MKDAFVTSPEYRQFISELKARVLSARISVGRAANRDIILLYWDIGRGIVEKQVRLGWGNSVVEMVARDLQRSFAASKSFSPDNLWRMRQLYVAYSAPEFLGQAVPEIRRTVTAFLGQAVPEKAQATGHSANATQKELASDDNPSIGIILCAEKDDVEVEYALRTKRNPIGVAAYQLQSKLPGNLRGKLPTAKQLSEAVRGALPERSGK